MGKKTEYYEEVSNFRELVKRYEKFGDNIAFKYKKEGEIKEISYSQFVSDIKKAAEKVLASDARRVAVIGNNRYEWVVTYLGVVTAGSIIVPLDKALTDKEIEKLLKRSEVDTVVYDEKYENAVNEAISQGCNINHKICMDNIDKAGVKKKKKMLQDGEDIIKAGKAKYDDVKLKKMKCILCYLPQELQVNQRQLCYHKKIFAKMFLLINTIL